MWSSGAHHHLSFPASELGAVTLLCALLPASSVSATESVRAAGATLSATVFIEPEERDTHQTDLLIGQFEDTLALQQYQEAEVIAKRFVEGLLDANVPDRGSLAQALQQLALVQRYLEQYDAAVMNYNAAIALIEEDGDMLSPHLIEPLQGLTRTYIASGDAGLALQTGQRALHVRRVNDGPHTLSQSDILSDMIDSMLLSNDLSGALELLDRIDMLYERKYSRESPELLPTLQRRAGLLNRMGDYDAERQVYRRIVGITASEKGDLDLALIDPYLKLAGTYISEADKVIFRSGPTTQTGETYLEKALNIAEQNPQTDWQTLERCLLALGDYYMVLSVHDRARLSYRRAWELTSSDPGYLEHRREHLERPVALRPIPLGRYADFDYGWNLDEIDADDLVEGHMTVSYTVTTRGKAGDIRVVDASPAQFDKMETRLRMRLKEFVFRPRYEDGEPVVTTSESLRHEFLYLPSTVSSN